jgi:hypothetical protein
LPLCASAAGDDAQIQTPASSRALTIPLKVIRMVLPTFLQALDRRALRLS